MLILVCTIISLSSKSFLHKIKFFLCTDWEGKLTVYYTINGSPKSVKVKEELQLEKWYTVEIKQSEKDGKVKNRKCFVIFLM